MNEEFKTAIIRMLDGVSDVALKCIYVLVCYWYEKGGAE